MTGPAPIPGVDSRSTTIDGATVRYLAAGADDASPIVLVHGGIVDEALLSWRSLIPVLATDYRVVAPDLPGYGDSDPPAATPTPEYYRDVVSGVMDAVEIDSATVIGLSLGGAVGLLLAKDVPERVDRLVAVDSYGLSGTVPGGRLAVMATRHGIHRLAFGLARRSRRVASWTPRLIVTPDTYHPELAADVAAAWQRPDAGRAFAATQRAELQRGGLRTNLLEALPAIRPPIRFVHGERDPLIPAHRSVRAATLATDADCRLLTECGHWPPRERPTAFHRAIADVLPA